MRAHERLTATERDEVHRLVAEAKAADQVNPLSESVLLAVASEAPTGGHLLLRGESAELLGYGHVDLAAGPPPTAELVVRPSARRHGHGGALLAALAAATPDGRLTVWAHGDLPAARALAASAGYRPVRELHLLRRPISLAGNPGDPAALPDHPPPAGVRFRAFRPGQDEQAWLALNARAFAHHPEQGRWSAADLRQRMAEPWFDPAGFLLAERASGPDAGALVGFHWTKIHPADPARGGVPLGEVYVLGVDPAAQGGGLGRALTVAGLRYLAGRGLTEVLLYVDGDNTAALRTYRGLGFMPAALDVMYGK
jgi:mycothiol synthase